MKQDNVEEIVLQLVLDGFKENESSGREFQIKGMENVHPIYEAAFTLIRRNLSDELLVKLFAQEPKSLNYVLGVNALYENMPQNLREKADLMIENGATLESIAELSALASTEKKRILEGHILSELDTTRLRKDKDLSGALRRFPNHKIYIEVEDLESLKKLASKKKAKRIGKRSTILAFAGAALVAGYFAYPYFQEHAKFSYSSNSGSSEISFKWENNSQSSAKQEYISPATQKSIEYTGPLHQRLPESTLPTTQKSIESTSTSAQRYLEVAPPTTQKSLGSSSPPPMPNWD